MLRRLLTRPAQILWIVIAYVPFLGGRNFLLTPDQKTHLNIALEMWERGSWLKPLIFGEERYLEPPFQYWATLLGWKALGFGMWGALLPSALAVAVTAWFISGIAGMFRQKRWSINTALIFAATAGTAFYATTAQTEIWLCLLYAGSWWAALRHLSAPIKQRQVGWLYLAFMLAGVSSLVLSPVYMIVWAAGFLLYLLISGEWELLIDRHLWLAALTGALVGSTWFAAVAILNPSRFWIDFVSQGEGPGALGFWQLLLYFSFPFTLLMFPALRALWKMRRSGDILRVLLCWSFPIVVFWVLSPDRFKAYLYLLFPAIALLVDWGYFRIGRSGVYRFCMMVTGILAAAGISVTGATLQQGNVVSPTLVAALVLVSAFAMIAAWRNLLGELALCVLAAILLLRLATVSMGEHEIRGLREWAVEQRDVPLGMVDESQSLSHEIGALSVALGRPLVRLSEAEQMDKFLKNGGAVILSRKQALGAGGKPADRAPVPLGKYWVISGESQPESPRSP